MFALVYVAFSRQSDIPHRRSVLRCHERKCDVSMSSTGSGRGANALSCEAEPRRDRPQLESPSPSGSPPRRRLEPAEGFCTGATTIAVKRLLGCEEQRDGAIAAFLGRLMHPTLQDDPLFKDADNERRPAH